MVQTWSSGRLILSDSPESPADRGILYKDTTLASTGTAFTNRVFVYHQADYPGGSLRFSVLIKNNGTGPGTLAVKAHGCAGPAAVFPTTGESAFYRYLTNRPAASVTIPAGAMVRLDTNFDSIDIPRGSVLNGIWDYTFNQPHSIYVCALHPSDDPITVEPTLTVLSRDNHERGTFASCNKIYRTDSEYACDTAGGIAQFPIGGADDASVTGYDNAVSPPTAETNEGNFGVLYRIRMACSKSDGRNLGFLIAPRAGPWCGAVSADRGILAGGNFIIPADGKSFSSKSLAAVEGKYAPSSSGSRVWLQFMPTAGAAFPVRVMAVPY